MNDARRAWIPILQLAALTLLPFAMAAEPARDRSIVLSTSSLTFSASEGGAIPTAQTLTLSNGGTHSMDWQTSVDRSWLTVSPSSGTLGNHASVVLTVTPVAAERIEVKREFHYALPRRVFLSLTSKDARLSPQIYRTSASAQLRS